MAMDPHQAIAAVLSMEAVLEASEGQRGSILLCLELFAGAGSMLVMMGIYGVMAYSVSRRGRELSIRRALGAQGSDILRLVLGEGLGLAFAGVALGLAAAWGLTRMLQSLLFEVSPTDPRIFTAAAVAMMVAALAASYFPARRARQISAKASL